MIIDIVKYTAACITAQTVKQTFFYTSYVHEESSLGSEHGLYMPLLLVVVVAYTHPLWIIHCSFFSRHVGNGKEENKIQTNKLRLYYCVDIILGVQNLFHKHCWFKKPWRIRVVELWLKKETGSLVWWTRQKQQSQSRPTYLTLSGQNVEFSEVYTENIATEKKFKKFYDFKKLK